MQAASSRTTPLPLPLPLTPTLTLTLVTTLTPTPTLSLTPGGRRAATERHSCRGASLAGWQDGACGLLRANPLGLALTPTLPLTLTPALTLTRPAARGAQASDQRRAEEECWTERQGRGQGEGARWESRRPRWEGQGAWRQGKGARKGQRRPSAGEGAREGDWRRVRLTRLGRRSVHDMLCSVRMSRVG